MKEFWANIVTDASWEKLLELKKEFKFVLIGGWAVYLWTNMHKSKDIDIIVDNKVLFYLKEKYELNKNNVLRKYEIKFDKFDVDIYVPFFSKLIIPEKELMEEYTASVQGIKTLVPEVLLVLKQTAELERRGTPKGAKDELDLMTLAINCNINWKKYKEILKRYNLNSYLDELILLVRGFNIKKIDYLGVAFKSFKKMQREIVQKLKY